VSPLPPLLGNHFRAPRHAGDPTDADAVGHAHNAACGDELELGLWLEAGHIRRIRYRARACSATLATASLVSEHLHGLSLDAAASADVGRLVEKAGGLPPGKRHACAVVERALADALRAVHDRYP
jgi:cysteine desulfurase/selenocysteine lyase